MFTIDGMPIVSGRSRVYGLFGIPNQMIDRVEVIKGPATGLYGSQAVGGLVSLSQNQCRRRRCYQRT
jgi:outer membrane receptor for ferrienterochelin and colicins